VLALLTAAPPPSRPDAVSAPVAAVAPEDPLIVRALAGDNDAWTELVALHDRRVFLTLLSRGIRPDEARDLCQESWARLLERQRGGRLAQLRLPGLAIAQALYLAIDARRRSAREATGLEDALESLEIADPACSVEERLLGRQRLDRAQRVIDALGASARAVFDAVYRGGAAPHAETAARLGLSEQRVKQIVCEVRKKIRAALAEGDADADA
jgi:RNA polymerase sigma-70 factor (ECF subfamily)